MADQRANDVSPFQKAAAEAERARRAAGAQTPTTDELVEARRRARPVASGSAFRPGESQVDQRRQFLATEAAQHLKAQQARMEAARLEAERARASLEVERLKSHIFIKKQELARVSMRLRDAESSLVAAEASDRRASTAVGASAGGIRESTVAREKLSVDRENAERDFERRELFESKAIEAIERDIDKLVRQSGVFAKNSSRYQELTRKRQDHQRSLASIRLERSRRRGEAATKDAALARLIASAERSELAARRAADLASSLVAKYRQQARAFEIAEQALESDLTQLEQQHARAEAAFRRAGGKR